MSGDKEQLDAIKVVVRCRPLSAQEKAGVTPVVLTCKGANEVGVRANVKGKQTTKQYTFDQVYNQFATQEQIYNGSIKVS